MPIFAATFRDVATMPTTRPTIPSHSTRQRFHRHPVRGLQVRLGPAVRSPVLRLRLDAAFRVDLQICRFVGISTRQCAFQELGEAAGKYQFPKAKAQISLTPEGTRWLRLCDLSNQHRSFGNKKRMVVRIEHRPRYSGLEGIARLFLGGVDRLLQVRT
jgi:hypothetical protein